METQKKMPVVFAGHGSPMLALEDSEVTRELTRLGEQIVREFDKPRAILAVSAHWFAPGTFVQSAPHPRQVYDMYGFPHELYEVAYPVDGDADLTKAVQEALGSRVSVNDTRGIDHGTWTVLVHLFPKADIPVVQLSVDQGASARDAYEIGQALEGLRDQGFLIVGSGNTVHNLGMIEWSNPDGTKATHQFNDAVVSAVERRNDEAAIDYGALPYAGYAVPTPDHYLPLLYCLGAARDEKPTVFNNVCNLGAIAMTGFAFGM